MTNPQSAIRNPQSSSVVSANPTVGRVAALPAALQVRRLQPGQCVGREGLALRFDIDAAKFRGVQTEDPGLVLLGELFVAEFLAEFVADLKPLEGIDDPLGG